MKRSSRPPIDSISRPRRVACIAGAALLFCCGPSAGNVTEPVAPAGPPAEQPASTASPSAAAPDPAPPAPAASTDASPAESASASLARDMLKRGGRRIGHSAQKKGFVYPEVRRTGASLSLAIVFAGEDGKPREKMRVCQAGECDEQLDELARAALPKLAARLDAEGYAPVRAIGWPSGRDELDLTQLGVKLRYAGGRLEGLRDGKPPMRLGAVGPGSPKLLAVFVVTDAKLLAVLASPDGTEEKQEMTVFKLP